MAGWRGPRRPFSREGAHIPALYTNKGLYSQEYPLTDAVSSRALASSMSSLLIASSTTRIHLLCCSTAHVVRSHLCSYLSVAVYKSGMKSTSLKATYHLHIAMSFQKTLQLKNGTTITIPQIGLGTWLSGSHEVEHAVRQRVRAYSHT